MNLVEFSHDREKVRLSDGFDYTYSDILNKDDDWFENCHNHIQILFPTNKPSQFNKDAPLLTPEDAANFCKENLKLGLERFYRFLESTDALYIPSHNDLRLTRAIECVALILGKKEAEEYKIRCMKLVPGKRFISTTNKAWMFWQFAPNHTF